MYKAIARYYLKCYRDRFWYALHNWTYSPGDNPKRVIVVGGSYGGHVIAKRLANSLPSGYTVTVVEKYKQHNHVFVFPRYSVYGGNEDKAFIPLEQRNTDVAPQGSLNYVFGDCVDVETDPETESPQVVLSDGTKIPYDYLVIATGSRKTPPADLDNKTAQEGIDTLKGYQQSIENSQNIAVVGAGAVGVELATDIKYKYGDTKDVTLFTSRDVVLPRFPKEVHDKAVPVIEELGVKIRYKSRPQVDVVNNTLTFESTTEKYDLVFSCVGANPATKPFESLYNDSLNSKTGGVSVKTTLQMDNHPNVFALGDVIDLEAAPKMARSANPQAEVITANILAMISAGDKQPAASAMATYTPSTVENALKLTLGLNKTLLHIEPNTDVNTHAENFYMDPNVTWTFFDVKYPEESTGSCETK